MTELKETRALKECAIVKGISYEIFGRGMVYLEAKTRKDITYGITVILEANPTFTLNDMDIDTVDGKVQAVVSLIEMGNEGG
jgi:hypothetical protein